MPFNLYSEIVEEVEFYESQFFTKNIVLYHKNDKTSIFSTMQLVDVGKALAKKKHKRSQLHSKKIIDNTNEAKEGVYASINQCG